MRIETRPCRYRTNPDECVGPKTSRGVCNSCGGKGYLTTEIYEYAIEDEELGIDYADCGPWRSYRLDTYGDNRDEMLANASVCEVDQDGGDLSSYALSDASNAVYDCAEKMIDQEIEKCQEAIDFHVDERLNANHGWSQ